MTLERPLSLAGITQAVNLIGGTPACPGYVDTVPDFVFDLATTWLCLISFVGTGLSTLMVDAEGQGHPLDVGSQEITLTPSLELAQPEQGRYMVYVGRGNLSGRQHRQAYRHRPVRRRYRRSGPITAAHPGRSDQARPLRSMIRRGRASHCAGRASSRTCSVSKVRPGRDYRWISTAVFSSFGGLTRSSERACGSSAAWPAAGRRP